ncbi:MAG: permease [Proteobacteria bacterium]|nr:permease [Pseudomonadota bacterium]
MEVFGQFVKEIVFFVNEVSIYLLFGFLVAGILHVIFPDSMIKKHLGKDSFGSVIKATLFGIPLPICSCGVVPVAASLKSSGASKGASISFLISTPQVGADSFLITYSLLGWVFGLFRIGASLVTAMIAGIMVNLVTRKDEKDGMVMFPMASPQETMSSRLKSFFRYLEYELLGSIANTLVIGILVAGLISAAIPDGFFESYLDYPFLSMIVMLIAGIPMYVCASASTPIAASLIMKGMSPGAALVFLLTGPATNAITIATVVRTLGKKSAVIYLASISLVSLLLGYGLNVITLQYGFKNIIMLDHHGMLPEWLKTGGSLLLIGMLLWYYISTKFVNKIRMGGHMTNHQFKIKIDGMTCMHCAGSVKKAVESIKGTKDVMVSLEDKNVIFDADNPKKIEDVKVAITAAGFLVVAG